MLTDHERKLLRILFHSTQIHGRVPTIDALEIKSGYRRRDIMTALAGLERQCYIVWPDHQLSEIKVIEGWERDQTVRAIPATRNPDYWTQF